MKYRNFFLSMAVMVLLASLSSLISPVLLQVWSASGEVLTVSKILLLTGVMAGVYAFQLLMTYFREVFAREFNKQNARSCLDCHFHMDYDAINRLGASNLLDRIFTVVNAVYEYMTGPAISFWSNLITMLLCLVLIGWTDPLAAVLLLGLAPVNYFGYKLLNRELAARSVRLSRACAESWQLLLSRCQQVDYLKQCPDYENVLREMDPALELHFGAMKDINVFAQMASQGIDGLNEIIRTLTMLLVVYNVFQKETGLASVIVYSVLLPVYVSHMKSVTNSNLTRKQYEANLTLLKEMQEEREADGTETLTEIEEIRFDCAELLIGEKRLTGPYQASFQKGDVVWVQGHSGCGKSTLMKLLPRLRSQPGVFINGKDIRCYQSRQLRDRINYLSQNVPIIKGTILENLFFNRSWNKENAAAFEKEPLLSTVLRTHKLQDMVEEGGANLSGGEKQKLAISRLLASSPDVWILDEITSNIDRAASVEILERILQYRKESIIFIISHDDLPAAYVNKIWKLETHQVSRNPEVI